MEQGLSGSKKEPNKKRGRKKVYLIIGGVAIAIIAAACIILYIRLNHSDQPSEISKAQKIVDFPLYYPSQVPPGFVFDKNVSSMKQVVLYSYTYNKNEKISVSIQPLTNEIDPNAFNPTSDFTTHIGRAYMVDIDLRTTAAVMGKKSWLLINASNNVPTDSFREFVEGFRPVQSQKP